jgi:hypothetical protein
VSAENPDLLERALQGSSRGLGLTRADVLVAAAVLVAAVALGAFAWLGGAAGTSSDVSTDGTELFAVVQNTEGLYEVLPLAQDAALTVEGELGTNVVEVSQGRVRVQSADCANQVCVNQGWADAAGTVICCLPHELTVEVVSDPNSATPLVS